MELARFTLRLHPVILKKLKIISAKYGRSVNKEIEKSFMDEIYHIFDSHASRIGVIEVPLVFFRGNVSELTELPDAADLNETENNTNQQTKSGSETSKEKPNSVPGFSFMYGLF